MQSKEIIEKFIKFYEKRGHKLVPNVSLVPENDPTLLYVNSGMFPLVPYLSGEPHPLGKRLMNVQRCLRFNEDLENVGVTNRHTTAFHMMGNWSLGDYFKKEQLLWVYEFLVEELGLEIDKIYATVFEGDKDAPKDEESIEIIKNVFKKYGLEAKENERIFTYGKKDNWWQRGEAVGELGGPDSEIFYYIGKEGTGFGLNPAEHQDDFIEIGNSVFMQYKRAESGWVELPQKNVDFGGGLERMALVSQNKHDIYETDNFYPIIQELEKLSGKKYLSDISITKSMRMLADHMRSATFLAMDNVLPSNKDQGYILRRLLRRMVRVARKLGLEKDVSVNLVPVVAKMFSWIYPALLEKEKNIAGMFSVEEEKFRKTLEKGAKEVAKNSEKIAALISSRNFQALADLAFDLYQSLGYPFEMYSEDLKEFDSEIETTEIEKLFTAKFEEHQQTSRSGAAQKFEGGLADHSEQTIRYHTATHLLNMALNKVLGGQITQHGSNITGERFRFDFNHSDKLSDVQIKEVEEIMNEAVSAGLPVNFEIMPTEKAKETGAMHEFNGKYGDSG